MASCLNTHSEENHTPCMLCEAKAFEQARERSFLKWPVDLYPPRMKMKEAGWFSARNNANQMVAVCLYCKTAVIGWKREDNPFKVHQILSPKCIFITSTRNCSVRSSPIISALPRHEEVSPSSHRMAQVFQRVQSFNQWPSISPVPSADILAGFGLFYTGENTQVECFFCHHQISITSADNDLMFAHADGCQYAEHLKEHSRRSPLDIKPSDKIYELIDKSIDHIHFLFLQCVNASSPAILLSALVSLPNEYQSLNSDSVLKHLRRHLQLKEHVNWAVSSDGPLVLILQDLARTPQDLTLQSIDIQNSIKDSLISPMVFHTDHDFQCRACSTIDASPHIVSSKCHHLGLCERECFLKWMTCVICGYTLGKTLRIRGV